MFKNISNKIHEIQKSPKDVYCLQSQETKSLVLEQYCI